MSPNCTVALKGNSHLKIVVYVTAGGMGEGGTDRQKTSAQPPGNCEAHMVLSWYGGNEWHMNKTSSPFHCACLVCPLSFLHRPIFTDTAPPTTTTTSSQPAATYITLTNQRLRGFFSFCLAFTADIYFSESTVPVSGAENEYSLSKNTSTLHLCITCCLFKSSCVSV